MDFPRLPIFSFLPILFSFSSMIVLTLHLSDQASLHKTRGKKAKEKQKNKRNQRSEGEKGNKKKEKKKAI